MNSGKALRTCKGINTVLGQLNRYLFKRAYTSIGGLIVFALAVLLLERLLRIFEIVSASTNPASDATQMVVNLLPHYLGIAIPMALMLGTIMTIDRFSRSSELSAAFGAGVSLFHMTKPFILISFVMFGFTLFIEGYMQPIGRYGYREVVNSVKQQSFAAVLREGQFTTVGNRTFFASSKSSKAGIGPVFIYEKLADGGLNITTAAQGDLVVREETGDPVLQLSEGNGFRVTSDKQVSGQIEFSSSSVTGTIHDTRFRARGDDERELTSTELFKNRKGALFPGLAPSVNNSALHLRLARAYLLLLLPFIAVPFGINYGRNPSSAGIFVGVVALLTLQKSLEFGQSLGAKGSIPPWAGVWPLMAVVTLGIFLIYRNSALKMGQPPLATLSIFMADILKDIRKGARALLPFARPPAPSGSNS